MADYDITNDYSTLKWEFTANFPIDKLQFVFGNVGGTISCDDFKLTKAGSDENLIEMETLQKSRLMVGTRLAVPSRWLLQPQLSR